MAYTTQLGMAGVVDDLISNIDKLGPAVQAASKAIEDPALPELSCNVLRLNKVVEGRNPGAPCKRKVYTAAQKKKGLGLHLAITPLRIATWSRQHPAIATGIGLCVLGMIWGIGYQMGKRR